MLKWTKDFAQCKCSKNVIFWEKIVTLVILYHKLQQISTNKKRVFYQEKEIVQHKYRDSSYIVWTMEQMLSLSVLYDTRYISYVKSFFIIREYRKCS